MNMTTKIDSRTKKDIRVNLGDNHVAEKAVVESEAEKTRDVHKSNGLGPVDQNLIQKKTKNSNLNW